MLVRHWKRWALPHVLSLVLVSALAAGCRDESRGNDGVRYGNDAEMTAPVDGEAAASRGQERLKARNPREWVGVAHNRMLDDFRAELRKPGLLTRNICEYVMSFSMNDDRLPAGRRHVDNRNWVGVRAAGDSSTLCSGGSRRPRASTTSMRWGLTPTAPMIAPQSTEALALHTDIENALFAASDARDLAVRLSAIYERSLRLPETDQAGVASTISVAQNSFEYWTQQYGLFEQEIIAEYAPCIEEQLAVGASDRVIESCLSGKSAGGAVADRLGAPKQRFVRVRPLTQCGYSMREGFRRVGLADAKGAATGFFTTLLSTGSLEAAGLAAIASGGASSIWAAVENAVVALKCMYGLT